jgi:DNA-directed RNA polymerase specialized sigma24 family protein
MAVSDGTWFPWWVQESARFLQPTDLDRLRRRDHGPVSAEFHAHRRVLERAARHLGVAAADAEEVAQGAWTVDGCVERLSETERRAVDLKLLHERDTTEVSTQRRR